MIVKLIGVPSLSPLRFQLLADQLSITYMMLKDRALQRSGRNYTVTKRSSPYFVSDVKVVYCSSVEVYSQISTRIAEAKTPCLVFVCDNPLLFEEHDVYMLNTFEISPGVYASVNLTSSDLMSSILAAHNLYHSAIPFDSPFVLKPQHSTAYTILTDIIEASALHLVQPLFYAIKDHSERKIVQDAVFLYLSGSQPRIGKAGEFSRIVEELASDRIQRLRSACIFAKGRDIDEAVSRFQVDRFEVNYVLSRTSLILNQASTK